MRTTIKFLNETKQQRVSRRELILLGIKNESHRSYFLAFHAFASTTTTTVKNDVPHDEMMMLLMPGLEESTVHVHWHSGECNSVNGKPIHKPELIRYTYCVCETHLVNRNRARARTHIH